MYGDNISLLNVSLVALRYHYEIHTVIIIIASYMCFIIDRRGLEDVTKCTAMNVEMLDVGTYMHACARVCAV